MSEMRDNACGKCEYHEECFIHGEGVCQNPESYYYESYTDDKAYCKAFEPKE